jgi:trigger factor
MNVALDYQPNCVAALEIDLPAERVKKQWDSVVKSFQKQARIPGYRPGKAPITIIETRYAKDIDSEVRESLAYEAVKDAAKEKNIRLLAIQKIEETTIGSDKSMKIRARVVHTPDFELPDYKSLSLEVPKKTITEADIDSFLDYLREPHSTFDPVTDRELAMDDYAVMTYEGTVEGKPVQEIAPKAPTQIIGRRNAWVLASPGVLVPGFAEAIVGMKLDEERTFTLDVPDTFPIEELKGSKITYKATLHGINIKKTPDFDDALAAKIEPGSTLESLKQKIRERQEEAVKHQFEISKRNAAIEKLLSQFTCELPESIVASETALALRDIVAESQARGIPDDELKTHTDKIVENAKQSATNRVRAEFLLLRIAEKENIEEKESEIYEALYEMAQRQEVPIKKLVKDLSRSGGLNRVREQIRASKALDLVVSNATVTEVADKQPAASA